MEPRVRIIKDANNNEVDSVVQLQEPIAGHAQLGPTIYGDSVDPYWAPDKAKPGRPSYGHPRGPEGDEGDLRREALQADLGHYLAEWMSQPMKGDIDHADLGPRSVGRPKKDAPVSRLIAKVRGDRPRPERVWHPGLGFPETRAELRSLNYEQMQELERHWPDWAMRSEYIPED
jgi:hypothetical protein